jgi:hypothetical protein
MCPPHRLSCVRLDDDGRLDVAASTDRPASPRHAADSSMWAVSRRLAVERVRRPPSTATPGVARSTRRRTRLPTQAVPATGRPRSATDARDGCCRHQQFGEDDRGARGLTTHACTASRARLA